MEINWKNFKHAKPREGVIIEWPLNGQFNDACDVILTPLIDIWEVEDNDNNNQMSIFTIKQRCKSLK